MSRKVAFYAVFAGLAILTGYVESLIPVPIPIPGVKLGLANVITIIVLYFINARAAFAVSLIRITVSGLLFSGLGALMYSIAGGLLSFLVMYLAKHTKIFGIVGVSVLGGIFHNVGQVLVAAFIVKNLQLFTMLPVLLISGVITGVLIGIVSTQTLEYLKKSRLKY